MIFSQNLFRRPTVPPQLPLSVEIGNPISLCWGPAPQLALFVEFLFEILYVGAPQLLYAGFPSASVLGPTPTRTACRISF
ncbi:pathogenicity island protein [Staphylococcus aureus]|nr:pathogenicity island protein [Staphylococcus aureus]